MPRTRPKPPIGKREQTAERERQRAVREWKAQKTGRNANVKVSTKSVEQ